MKVFKDIFRLDYPISYSLIDRFGEQLEFITQQTSEAPFKNFGGEFDIANHSITAKGQLNEDRTLIKLDVRTFHAVTEHKDGLEIEKVKKYPLFELADKIVERLEIKMVTEYERIGFRSWILVEEDSLKFDNILKYIVNSNNLFNNVVTKHFSDINDISLVIESKTSDDNYIRINLGPYQEAEVKKYFALTNSIKEGLIIDIDIWQVKVKIPGFKLTEFVKYTQNICYNMVNDIKMKLLESLKNGIK